MSQIRPCKISGQLIRSGFHSAHVITENHQNFIYIVHEVYADGKMKLFWYLHVCINENEKSWKKSLALKPCSATLFGYDHKFRSIYKLFCYLLSSLRPRCCWIWARANFLLKMSKSIHALKWHQGNYNMGFCFKKLLCEVHWL